MTFFKKFFILLFFLILYFSLCYIKVELASNGSKKIENVDAVLVLGAAQYNGTASPALRERTLTGINMFNKYHAKYIILSGGFGNGDKYSEAEVSAKIVRQSGIPESAIIIENSAKTTYDSMRAVKNIILSKGLLSVVICSDGYHLESSKSIASSLWNKKIKIYTAASNSSIYPKVELSYQKIRETIRIGLAQIVGYRRVSSNGSWFTSKL